MESEKLCRKWVGKVLHRSIHDGCSSDSGPTRKCGVAILIRKSLPVTIIKTWKDPDGRYIFAKLRIGGTHLCVGSVYAPTGAKKSFFLHLNRLLSEIGASQYLIGRDWNIVRDPVLDRTGQLDKYNAADRALLNDIMKIMALLIIGAFPIQLTLNTHLCPLLTELSPDWITF